MEAEVVVLGTGSPDWFQLLSLQGVRLLLVLAAVMAVVVRGAPDGVTSLSASPIKPCIGLG